MKLFLLAIFFIFIHIEHSRAEYIHQEVDYSKKWTQTYEDKLAIKMLIQILEKSQTGQNILELAHNKAAYERKELIESIEAGQTSLTDTTLSRRFSASDPSQVEYNSHSKVFINRDLKTFEAVLDLAHELVHFIYREAFNPYESHFTMHEFVNNTIAAKGGEAHAFLMECKVRHELFPKTVVSSQCAHIKDDKGEWSLKHTIEKFYQLGYFFDQFTNSMGPNFVADKFPWASDKEVLFVSSAYGLPYPLAAYKEYTSVMERVCANDKKRLAYFEKGEADRAPSSEFNKLKLIVQSRCQHTRGFANAN